MRLNSKAFIGLYFVGLASGCCKPISLAKQYAYIDTVPKPVESSPKKDISITCKPLFLTDLSFEPNETVQSVNVGDSARWLFQSVNSHNGNHLFIKPFESELTTNAIVITSQKTYHLHLASIQKGRYTNIYRFFTPGYKPNSKMIDDHYLLKKCTWFQPLPSWAPTYVYNDGKQTYIQMPSNFYQIKAPILYELDADNNVSLVNYYFRDNHYIVDQILDRAALLKENGRKQEKLLIIHEGNKHA